MRSELLPLWDNVDDWSWEQMKFKVIALDDMRREGLWTFLRMMARCGKFSFDLLNSIAAGRTMARECSLASNCGDEGSAGGGDG